MPNCGVAPTIVRLVITGAATCVATPVASARAPSLRRAGSVPPAR